MKRIHSFIAVMAFALPLAAQSEPEMNSGDIKKLGKPFGEWVDAKIESDHAKASEMLLKLDDIVQKMDKKLKGRSALSLVRDWEIVLQTGRSFDRSGPDVKKGKVIEQDLGAYGTFLIWLPAGYNPDKVNYPGILLLDSDPQATIDGLTEETKEAFIIFAPMISGLDKSALMEEEGRQLIIGPIGRCTVAYRLDRSRLFMIGKGDQGASFAAAYAAVLPHFFSGVAFVEGETGEVKGAANHAMLPVEKQDSVEAAATWMLGLEAANKYPTSFDVELVEPWQGVFYWVQAVKYDTGKAVPEGESTRLKVSVDRGTNTITIDGAYVYQVRLMLNDILVDLDKPITILRNGESYSYQASRSLGTLLENYVGLLDGSVYPAQLHRLDLPTEAEEPTDG
ncbi:MAG: hypothetical protein O3A95_07655 [Planctomycetota bacterium]|nr:hypothetical protein [Planctomycetota bacterium]MDA1114156.1 hypothetical protein [Planctomycetota bacterium]